MGTTVCTSTVPSTRHSQVSDFACVPGGGLLITSGPLRPRPYRAGWGVMVGPEAFFLVAAPGVDDDAGGSERSSCSRSAAISAAVIGAITPLPLAAACLSFPWTSEGAVVLALRAVAAGSGAVAGCHFASLHFSIELSPIAVARAYPVTPLAAVSASAAARRLMS